MIERFILYGMAGCLMEILWTGIHSLIKHNFTLPCNTSLWMFPIYGCAVFLEPVCLLLRSAPLFLRGMVYMCLIFAGEYMTGFSLQKLIGTCPWDYSGSHFQVHGLIRLDYAPAWFVVGLLFEQLFFHIS